MSSLFLFDYVGSLSLSHKHFFSGNDDDNTKKTPLRIHDFGTFLEA